MEGYRNYKCRLCGQMISRRVDNYVNDAVKGSIDGILVDKYDHPHCSGGVEETEKVLCDLVSISDKLLERAVDILNPEELS